MPIDKYILLRYADYERLIAKHPNIPQQIDTKTLYHSDSGGLSENAPSERDHQSGGGGAVTERSRTGVISGSGRGSIEVSGGVRSGERQTTSKAGEREREREREDVETANDTNWFDVWESLHFPK